MEELVRSTVTNLVDNEEEVKIESDSEIEVQPKIEYDSEIKVQSKIEKNEDIESIVKQVMNENDAEQRTEFWGETSLAGIGIDVGR